MELEISKYMKEVIIKPEIRNRGKPESKIKIENRATLKLLQEIKLIIKKRIMKNIIQKNKIKQKLWK